MSFADFVPLGSNLRPGIKLYFADLREADWVEQQGYRVTTLVRTLLDQQINNLPENDVGLLLRQFYDRVRTSI